MTNKTLEIFAKQVSTDFIVRVIESHLIEICAKVVREDCLNAGEPSKIIMANNPVTSIGLITYRN